MRDGETEVMVDRAVDLAEGASLSNTISRDKPSNRINPTRINNSINTRVAPVRTEAE